MKNILKYIIVLMTALMSVSCAYDVDNNDMTVIGETSYELDNNKTVYTIQTFDDVGVETLLYVLSERDDFEVSDKVKLIKKEK